MDLLNQENLCGQNLLRIVSRGSAILAELLRLADNIPEAFLLTSADSVDTTNVAHDISQLKYKEILFDFNYLRTPEDFENKVNASAELLEIDIEFQENHEEILDRFYLLFESIWKYQMDLNKFIEDVMQGYYIQHSLENILDELVGKQLLSEALYLYGVMLLFLEEKIIGSIREKMLIALYRYNGDGKLINIDEVCKLCRSTGYVPGANGRKPKKHPESLFGRFPPHTEYVRLLIGRLQTDDIYHMSNTFPNPDHRSVRLATQASMLYVILYFVPDILHNKKSTMREVVDKYFNDNWIVPIYMGHVVDLTVEWAHYPAAKTALDNQVTLPLIKDLSQANLALMQQCAKELKEVLTEGVLVTEYVLDNINPLLNLVRKCNIALRWRLLHRRCSNQQFATVLAKEISGAQLMSLLMNSAQFEYILKTMLNQLLDEKDHAWNDGKTQAATYLTELSEYFTGEKALTKVKRNEKMMNWFANLSSQITNLNIDVEHTTSTGRKIQGVIAALEDVEQFEDIDNSLQVKTYLQETRELLKQMIRTVNIKHEFLTILENICDFTYAWIAIKDYLHIFHEKIVKDPNSVILLRATFLKAASILDAPLVRIMAIQSPDSESVAEYYSNELVNFVRLVLEIIPISVFKILYKIEQIQTNQMVEIPIRIEAKELKDYSQLDLRLELAKLTYEVSIFTEGILLMQKTLLGVIQVDPREILEEGLCRELIRLISQALHDNLSFQTMTTSEITIRYTKLAATLDGIKRSIEYLQDFIDVAGLKIYQEAMTRIINYNTEQEANKYVKKKIFDSNSRYQNKTIPIPRYAVKPIGNSNNNSKNKDGLSGVSFDKDVNMISINFMGRIMESLLFLTDATKTVYSPEYSTWYQYAPTNERDNNIIIRQNKAKMMTQEIGGLRLFSLLDRAMGTMGLRGLDRLLSFRIVHQLNTFVKFYDYELKQNYQTIFDQVRDVIDPLSEKLPINGAGNNNNNNNAATISKTCANAIAKLETVMPTVLTLFQKLGQSQLLRRQVQHTLQFDCHMDAHLLYLALNNFNQSLLNDVTNHLQYPEKFPYPDKNNSLLYETTLLLESCGMDDPTKKIYVTSHVLESLPVLLHLFVITYIPKLEYDNEFGALVRRKPKYPLDGYPIIVGMACLLRQYHPIATKKFFQYIGQFIKMTMQTVYIANDVETKPVAIPEEILHIVIFMEQLSLLLSLTRDYVTEFIPAHLFDTAKSQLS